MNHLSIVLKLLIAFFAFETITAFWMVGQFLIKE